MLQPCRTFKKLTVSTCFTILVMYLFWYHKLSFISNAKQILESMLKTPVALPAPSVFLETKGGLGNQLFEYACHYALAKKLNFSLYVRVLDNRTFWGRSRSFGPGDRPFVLDQFKIPLPPAFSVPTSWKVTSSLTKLTDQDLLLHKVDTLPNLNQRILTAADYCQSEHFFLAYKEELRPFWEVKEEALSSKSYRKWSEEIRQSKCPICMHIRRGDFNDNARLPVSYFREALEKLNEALRKRNVQECFESRKFFLFSDDLFSSLENEFGSMFFRDLEPYTMVSGQGLNTVEEFKLMSECDHNIIPASSYGWWAAYLNRNKDKVVVAGFYSPKNFGDNEHMAWQYRHLYYPADWIVIDPWRDSAIRSTGNTFFLALYDRLRSALSFFAMSEKI